ncbi:MAG: hypothetical protein V1913_09455, partial [Fibrobacterota bacterium]
ALALHCKSPEKAPCHTCASCRKILHYDHPDFRIVFPFVSEASFEDVAKELGLRAKVEKERRERITLGDLYRQYYTESARALVQSPFTRPAVAEALAGKNREIFIANIRALIGGDREDLKATGFFEMPPSESSCKTVIILEAELMNSSTSNCLLKTLEEPPSYVRLLLVSSQPNRLLPTVRSRCQRMAFGPLEETEVKDFLTGRMKVGAREAAEAARLSMGSVQAALDFADPDNAELLEEARKLAGWLTERNTKAGLALAADFAEGNFNVSQRRLLFAAAYLRANSKNAPGYPNAIRKLSALHDALGHKANSRLAHSAFMLSFHCL